MNVRSRESLLAVLAVAGVLSASMALWADPAPDVAPQQVGTPADATPAADDLQRVSVAMARDRAKVMHDVYAATLDMLHHRYFHIDRAVVPARALEDVFSEMQRQSDVQARWISVNLKAMSLDHEPKTDFENRAATEIAAGKTEYESVEEGYYRRAGAVRLASSCVNCHGGFFKGQDKVPRFAALVISVPVQTESRKPD